MEPIYVTKTYLPPQEEYERYVSRIWQTNQLTNQGPLLKELETKLKDSLSLQYVHFVANGTIALQLALKALGISEGEVITTPFSYVATTSAILWEHCKPVFVDIEPNTFCIDPDKIEAAITPNTKVILAVHVFGFPCDVDRIETIAKKHNIKVIYDGAHAFGVKFQGKSLLSYGDISTCSFHATKLFHTVEGGCVITSDKTLDEKIELMKRFGHQGDAHISLGINAKASEFHAAMGLCNLGHIDEIIQSRKKISELYDETLGDTITRPHPGPETIYNHSYYPVLLDSEQVLLQKIKELNELNIYPRRYFYPSLNTLPYLKYQKQTCTVSEDIAKRIMCLPLFVGLEESVVSRICEVLKK